MLLPKALAAALFAAHVHALTNITRIMYCPFDVKLAPADDPKSLDFTYTSTDTPIFPADFNGKACLLELRFETPGTHGDVYLEEIEYKSNKGMSIETKLAWNGNVGPAHYETADVTGAGAVVVRNTTWNTMAFCAQQPHMWKSHFVYLQTKFSDAAVGPDFKLEQKARLRFGEGKACAVVPECDEPDIDQKFPRCDGVPGGHPWDDST